MKGRKAMDVAILSIYLGVGAIAGILAGLLGIGGGLVLVPMLLYTQDIQGFTGQHSMHIALGTSMASIVFTSFSSFLAHHRRGAVDWTIVQRISVGTIAGTLCGTWLVSRLPADLLKGFFAVFLYYTASQMILDRKPPASRGLPEAKGMAAVGGVIGMVSSMLGIGGGVLSTPFMIWCNVEAPKAIGTSAAIGFPLAVAASIGYLVNGFKATSLPPYSLGFIYLPALIGIILASTAAAPMGARLAHTLPVRRLKLLFALLLILLASKMVWNLLLG
jgi:uncharacterized membrane protein YfcA